MGKHKHKHKSKKSKKNKNTSDSDSVSDAEIVWTENVSNEPEFIAKSDEIDESRIENSNSQNKDELFDFLQNIPSQRSVKQTTKDKNKKEAAAKEEQTRYSRELNSYYRDDVNKRFIDDSEHLDKFRHISADKNEENSAEQNKKNMNNSERNSINAKIIKAEMMGNTELANELKEKLKQFDQDNQMNSSIKYVEKSKSKDKKASEDQMSIKEMFLKTKNITAREESMRFIASTSKIRSADDEYEDIRVKKKSKMDIIGFDRILNQNDDNECKWCQSKIDKHLILKFPFQLEHCFVTLTPYKPFIPNLVQIVSKNHSARFSIAAEKDCWTEIWQIMKRLSLFFEKHFHRLVIFMETCFINKKHQNISDKHFVIECVPVKDKYASNIRLSFFKEINQIGEEWSDNKKLIKLEHPITRKIPKGLSYFWESIGPMFEGYAHVIEDENYFDKHFGKQVICGVLNLDYIAKLKFQTFDEQHERIKELKIKWNNFNSNF